ncbi:MoaF-related domain-containing protein [Cupriavidus basilensis]
MRYSHLSAMALGTCLTIASTTVFAQSTFPAAGHAYDVKFGDRQFRLDFDANGKEMKFARPDGSGDTVQYTAVEIRPNLFIVYWTEPKSGTHVTHVEDFESGIVYAVSFRKDGSSLHAKGTIQKAP